MCRFVHSNPEEARVKKYAAAGTVALAIAGFSHGAVAQDYAQSSGPVTPWYVGLGIGYAYANIPEQTIDGFNSALLDPIQGVPGATFSIIDKDKRSTDTKLFLGYGFSRYLAVEGGYAYLGTSSVNMNFYNGAAANTQVGNFNMDYKMSAWFIDAVGMYPLSDKWSLLGRLGVSYSRVSASTSGEPLNLLVSSNDKTDNVVREKFGAGLNYNFSPAFTGRAEWERYKMPDPFSSDTYNVDAATVSVLFRF
jgi:OOP family OmpA-OmpF porin